MLFMVAGSINKAKTFIASGFAIQWTFRKSIVRRKSWVKLTS